MNREEKRMQPYQESCGLSPSQSLAQPGSRGKKWRTVFNCARPEEAAARESSDGTATGLRRALHRACRGRLLGTGCVRGRVRADDAGGNGTRGGTGSSDLAGNSGGGGDRKVQGQRA